MDCLHGRIGDTSRWKHASVFYYKPHPQDAIVCCSSKFVLHTIGDKSSKIQNMEGHRVPSSLDALFSPKSQGYFYFVLFSFFFVLVPSSAWGYRFQLQLPVLLFHWNQRTTMGCLSLPAPCSPVLFPGREEPQPHFIIH